MQVFFVGLYMAQCEALGLLYCQVGLLHENTAKTPTTSKEVTLCVYNFNTTLAK